MSGANARVRESAVTRHKEETLGHKHASDMSDNSSLLSYPDCLLTYPNSLIFTSFTVASLVLVLPPCSLVLYHGLQRCRKRRSSSTHSDSLTYNTAALEVTDVIGRVICSCSIYGNTVLKLKVGYDIITFSCYGKTFFHVLICLEHYLAVLHPIAYRGLREERWIRTRNILFGCIWLVCFVPITVTLSANVLYFEASFLISSFLSISFCSCSVLCALIRAGPQSRSRADPSKQRAFYTVTVIVTVLLLRYCVNVTWVIWYLLDQHMSECMWFIYEFWTNLPGCLVLTLLFLHRTGTLACCKSH